MTQLLRMSRSTFNSVYSAGSRLSTPYFLVISAPVQPASLAVVIPKTQVKKSTARHQLQRRIRVAVNAVVNSQSTSISTNSTTNFNSLIIIIRPALLKLDPSQFHHQFMSTLRSVITTSVSSK